jgi:hypothetical protein
MTASVEVSRRLELYWIPLGAGGSGFVRANGRIYEWAKARLEQRSPLDLYHTALIIRGHDSRIVIETMWPSPDPDTASRGVVLEGPVFSPSLSRLRKFRYEVRVWGDGSLPDEGDAVGGPRVLTGDSGVIDDLLESTCHIPRLVWGRDQIGAGDMWNSNSVISWLLLRAGLDLSRIEPPEGGRAPGWLAGLAAAGADVSSLPDAPGRRSPSLRSW